MNDIVITKIIEPDQTVVVLAGEGYVAIEVYYEDLRAEKSTVPDAIVLHGLAAAERLKYALGSAVIMANQFLGVTATTTSDE